jgi:hypothetical protein
MWKDTHVYSFDHGRPEHIEIGAEYNYSRLTAIILEGDVPITAGLQSDHQVVVPIRAKCSKDWLTF